MRFVREAWAEIKAAFGTRWYVLGLSISALVSRYDWFVSALQQRGMNQLIGIPDWAAAIIILAGWTAVTAIVHAVKLRRTITPTFDVVFERHGHGVVQAIERGLVTDVAGKSTPYEFRANYIRVTANVTSKTAVKNCFAIITKVERGPLVGNGPFIEIPLPQPVLVTETPRDMFPQMPNLFDFAVASEKHGLCIVRNWPFVLENSFRERATYRFSLTVYGDGGNQAKDVCVDVIWQGDWNAVTAVQASSAS